MCYGYDTYTTNISLEEALKPDVMLVHTVEGEPLPLEHGEFAYDYPTIICLERLKMDQKNRIFIC
jgi:hypothetical protein